MKMNLLITMFFLLTTFSSAIVPAYGKTGDLSAFIDLMSEKPIPFEIKLQNSKGEICGKTEFTADSKEWRKYSAPITAIQSSDSCHWRS